MYPAPYGRGLEYNGSIFDRALIRMMRNADIHIFPNVRLANYMQPIIKALKSQIAIIPHVVLQGSRQVIKEDRLRLIHSGNLYPPRSPRTFMEAIGKFVNKYDKPKFKFCILGNLSKNDQLLLSEYNLNDYVEYLKPVEYSQSLALLNNFDVSVIIEADCEEGIYLPTKVADFMQMQIPIFSVSPSEGVLHDLYNEGNIPYFANVKDVDGITQTLDAIYNDFLCGNIKSNIVPKEYLPDNVIDTYYKF